MPHRTRKRCESETRRTRSCSRKRTDGVYGDFIRTFTFSTSLPIVQPGGSVIFPDPIVTPKSVRYVDDSQGTGVLVPRGIYEVLLEINPGIGGQITILVNGQTPMSKDGFAYTQQISQGATQMEMSYLIDAPHRENLISVQNTGANLMTLGDLANTRQGNTSILTHLRIEKVQR
jgi:hypothetical protein